jgi:hypothetical protein
MAEYDGIEIPEELLEKVAGGTIPPDVESGLTKLVIKLKNAGQSKEYCIKFIQSFYNAPAEDITAIVEKAYA